MNVRFYKGTIGPNGFHHVESDILQMVNSTDTRQATDGADIVLDLNNMSTGHALIGYTVSHKAMPVPSELRSHKLSGHELWFSLVRSTGSGQVQEVRVLSVAVSGYNQAAHAALCVDRHLAM